MRIVLLKLAVVCTKLRGALNSNEKAVRTTEHES